MVENDETKKPETKDEKPEEKKEEKPKTNILEETKALLEDVRKERAEISQIKDELQQLRSDQLLSGTGGGHIEAKPPKEETPIEYQKRVMGGGLNAKPTETEE